MCAPLTKSEGGMQSLYDNDDALNYLPQLGNEIKSHLCTVMRPLISEMALATGANDCLDLLCAECDINLQSIESHILSALNNK